MKVYYKSERHFDLYAFEISENYLLIRDHAYGEKNRKSIDLLFTHTSYLESASYFSGIEIVEPTPKEVSLLQDKHNFPEHESGKVFVLISRGKRYYIKAEFLSIYENDLGLKKHYLGRYFKEGPKGKYLYEKINAGAKEFRKENPYLFPNWSEEKRSQYSLKGKFSLWGINLSHGYLSLKSLNPEGKAIYIDVLALAYIELKPELEDIDIDSSSEQENKYLAQKCPDQPSDSMIDYVLSSKGKRYFIRAAHLSIYEYKNSVYGYEYLFKDQDFGELILDSRTE